MKTSIRVTNQNAAPSILDLVKLFYRRLWYWENNPCVRNKEFHFNKTLHSSIVNHWTYDSHSPTWSPFRHSTSLQKFWTSFQSSSVERSELLVVIAVHNGKAKSFIQVFKFVIESGNGGWRGYGGVHGDDGRHGATFLRKGSGKSFVPWEIQSYIHIMKILYTSGNDNREK